MKRMPRYIHCYKLSGHNIVLDIASGAVHSVDDITYDVIQLYDNAFTNAVEQGLDPTALTHAALPPSADTDAVINSIENLIKQGKLFTRDTYASIAQDRAAARIPLKALCLNVSHACNMSCGYCFAGKIACEDALMPFDTGKQAIDFLIDSSGTIKTLDVDFFGGEPLLNWKVIKEIVAYARIAERMTGKKFRFTLTTNGLLIDDDVIDFTNRQFHNVVLSLDGRPGVHDACRKQPGGAGSYDEVLPKIKKLVEARRGKGYYIRGTFTCRNKDFSNDVLHLAGLGFLEISLEPVVTNRGNPLGFTDEDLPELCLQYDIIATEIQRRREFAKYVRPEDIPAGDREFRFYHFNLDLEHGPCVHKRIAGCGAATQYLAVTPDGALYPCHQFAGNSAYKAGDVWSGILNSSLRAQFAAANIYTRQQCKDCWARFYCSGGCAANACRDTGSIDGVYEFGCKLFKKRIENAIMLQF